MFTIFGGKTEFKQWDLEQLVTCDCLQEGDEVVFSGHGKIYRTTAFVQEGKVWADVPNFMLNKAGSFVVDLGWGLHRHMDCRTVFNVAAKAKPEDYVCPYNIKPRNTAANNGGVLSWNNLTDKPFYEGKAFEPIVWDGTTEGHEIMSSDRNGWSVDICKLHDSFIPAESLDKIAIKFNGEVINEVPASEAVVDGSGWYISGMFLASKGDMICAPGAEIIPEGLWVFLEEDLPEGFEATILPATTVKPLDEKYMPILTSPSGMKFRLTVDDSGTVSAVEVTE